MTRSVSLVIAVCATALWLGLAVLGWGGLHAFLAHPARVALIGVTFLLVLASVFTQGNLSSGEEEDRGNRWVLWLFFVIGGLDGWLPAYGDRVDLFTIGGDGVRWAGVALFAIGGVLRVVPVFILGRRFSGLVAIQHDHALVTDGLYRVIRNPSYLGLLIMLAGWALSFRSLCGLVLTALFVPPLVARMHSEEALLARHFGAEYEAYRARTWRLIPYVY
ncbi:MAG TPA: isoprenylcysteine carboxylmethyltransferase family protein [Kofleriaceae bacterium]|nr:isoprenylcysteine carboxylmethyltransferase family protein [Kofleriaceae bacterium]